MEQSDHDAFVEAEEYSQWLLEEMADTLDDFEKEVLISRHLLISAEEVRDELHKER